MLNIFATSLLTATRTSHLYQTEKSPSRPSQVSQSDLDLFLKDLSKSPLTGFFSRNLWQTYAQRKSDRDKTTDLGDPKPRQQPVPKWSAPDWWRQNRPGWPEIKCPSRCLTPCCWFATSDRLIEQLYSKPRDIIDLTWSLLEPARLPFYTGG